MKKKRSGYIQMSRKLMESKGVYELRRAERAEGLGVFIMIVFELAKNENAIGNEETLLIISMLAHKKKGYVWHIINDFGLFNVDGEKFQCILLQKTFNIETILGDQPLSGEPTVDEQPLNGESTSLYKVRAEARKSPIQNTRIQNTMNYNKENEYD
ncbi:Lin1244/Lin1753 domain-containing protein [Xylanibacter oryzae]|uniref:Lin1244/Lin1753 domain-containing protein n=1 Tax=Xylanibacter oryzae TaxID=185293 RepID=UPI0004B90445|nr:Lin1244/Lin1753 domain-containing protein [Xylanibacter oryzae]